MSSILPTQVSGAPATASGPLHIPVNHAPRGLTVYSEEGIAVAFACRTEESQMACENVSHSCRGRPDRQGRDSVLGNSLHVVDSPESFRSTLQEPRTIGPQERPLKRARLDDGSGYASGSVAGRQFRIPAADYQAFLVWREGQTQSSTCMAGYVDAPAAPAASSNEVSAECETRGVWGATEPPRCNTTDVKTSLCTWCGDNIPLVVPAGAAVGIEDHLQVTEGKSSALTAEQALSPLPAKKKKKWRQPQKSRGARRHAKRARLQKLGQGALLDSASETSTTATGELMATVGDLTTSTTGDPTIAITSDPTAVITGDTITTISDSTTLSPTGILLPSTTSTTDIALLSLPLSTGLAAHPTPATTPAAFAATTCAINGSARGTADVARESPGSNEVEE